MLPTANASAIPLVYTSESMRRSRGRWIAAAMLAGIVEAPVDEACARPSHPVLRQVTALTEGSIERLKIRRQKGNALAFVSDGDVMGPGTATAGREIYYFDAEAQTLQRVTNSGAGESWAASQPIDDINIGDRAEFVSFVSTGDFDPERDNSDGNPEIFV